jgi:hypothetical protein
VFDLSRPETLDEAIKWKNKIDANIRLNDGESLIPTLLIANKVL